MTRPWYLYMIECVGGSIYTGITTDVPARYSAHAAGKGAKYTRAFPPVSLLKVVECADRSAASRFEYSVKRLSAAAKRRFIESTASAAAA